jgi:hypothetical protein
MKLAKTAVTVLLMLWHSLTKHTTKLPENLFLQQGVNGEGGGLILWFGIQQHWLHQIGY